MEKIEKLALCKKEIECFDGTFNAAERKKIDQLITSGLEPIHQNVTCRVADSLQESFVYLYSNRNRESQEIRIITENFVQLYNQTLKVFAKNGMEELLGSLLPLFKKARLSTMLPDLEWEQAIFAKAGLNYKTVAEFGEYLDENLAEAINKVEKGRFSMDHVMIPDSCGYLGSHDGNSWDGFVGFLSGAILVANAVCTLPTAGVAATSIVAGVAGGGYAVTR